jgi:hypothetical protein
MRLRLFTTTHGMWSKSIQFFSSAFKQVDLGISITSVMWGVCAISYQTIIMNPLFPHII